MLAVSSTAIGNDLGPTVRFAHLLYASLLLGLELVRVVGVRVVHVLLSVTRPDYAFPTYRHELSFPLPLRAINVHALLALLVVLFLADAEVDLLIVLLAFLLRPRANVCCGLGPVAETVEYQPRDEQQLLVRAPVW